MRTGPYGDDVPSVPSPACGRVDDHPTHEWGRGGRDYTCPGTPVTEGGYPCQDCGEPTKNGGPRCLECQRIHDEVLEERHKDWWGEED